MENQQTENQKLDDTIISSTPENHSESAAKNSSLPETKETEATSAAVKPKSINRLSNEPHINDETAPLNLLQSLLFFVVLAIPLLNFIFVLRWSFRKGINRNKKNMARAFLIISIFSLIFYYFGQDMIGNLF